MGNPYISPIIRGYLCYSYILGVSPTHAASEIIIMFIFMARAPELNLHKLHLLVGRGYSQVIILLQGGPKNQI